MGYQEGLKGLQRAFRKASKGLRMFDIEEMGPNMQMDHLAGASKPSARPSKRLRLARFTPILHGISHVKQVTGAVLSRDG